MSLDPVCSSKYGNRPLLDLPALDVAGAGAGGSLMLSHLPTMAPPPIFRPNPAQNHQQQLALTGAAAQGASGVPGIPAMMMPPAHFPLPGDWPIASQLPGSLFAAPPGPLPYRSPQMFPYSFLHMHPFTLQPPPYQITDSSGQPLIAAGGGGGMPGGLLSPEAQQLSRLYPGVVDPLPPQGYGAGGAGGGAGWGFAPPVGGLGHHPGLVPQSLQVAEQKPVERVFFEGVLTYGELSPVHGQDKNSTAYWKLPEFLRQELTATYGHVPATDVQVVAINGEFHVYANPRRQAAWGAGGGGGGEEGGEVTLMGYHDQDASPDRRLIV